MCINLSKSTDFEIGHLSSMVRGFFKCVLYCWVRKHTFQNVIASIVPNVFFQSNVTIIRSCEQPKTKIPYNPTHALFLSSCIKTTRYKSRVSFHNQPPKPEWPLFLGRSCIRKNHNSPSLDGCQTQSTKVWWECVQQGNSITTQPAICEFQVNIITLAQG